MSSTAADRRRATTPRREFSMKLSSRLLALAVFGTAITAPARAADLDPLLPAKSESVMVVNVTQVLTSDLFKKYARGQVEQALEGNDAQKMLTSMGLDPMKDIDRVSVGIWGDNPQDMQALAVMRGKFEPKKLFTAVQQAAKDEPDQVELVTEGGYQLIKIMPKDQDKPIYAAVASDTAIVAGSDKAMVAAAFADAQNEPKAKVKKELATLVAQQDAKASMFMVGLTDGKIELPPNFSLPVQGIDPEKLADQLQAMQSVAIVVHVTDGVALDIAMGMKDGDAAEDFGETVKELLSTAKVFIPIIAAQQPQFQPVAQELGKTLGSKVGGNSVSIGIKLSGDTIAKAAGAAD